MRMKFRQVGASQKDELKGQDSRYTCLGMLSSSLYSIERSARGRHRGLESRQNMLSILGHFVRPKNETREPGELPPLLEKENHGNFRLAKKVLEEPCNKILLETRKAFQTRTKDFKILRNTLVEELTPYFQSVKPQGIVEKHYQAFVKMLVTKIINRKVWSIMKPKQNTRSLQVRPFLKTYTQKPTSSKTYLTAPPPPVNVIKPKPETKPSFPKQVPFQKFTRPKTAATATFQDTKRRSHNNLPASQKFNPPVSFSKTSSFLQKTSFTSSSKTLKFSAPNIQNAKPRPNLLSSKFRRFLPPQSLTRFTPTKTAPLNSSTLTPILGSMKLRAPGRKRRNGQTPSKQVKKQRRN